MILTPEDDEIVPPEFQRSIFDSLQSKQKRFEIVKGRGHMNFLANLNFDELLAGQLAFLKDVLKF
jgi:fumagillin biosynthesis transferase